MVSVEEAVIARLSKEHEHFEIMVDSELALELKRGGQVDIENVLAVRGVFKDAKKGERVPDEDLQKHFGTVNIQEIARKIVTDGQIQLTTEQRRKMTEEKRKQIADIISKQGINPQTKLPNPPTRIMNAMDQAHVVVDPFRKANEQVKGVVDQINSIVPISFERVEVAIKVPLDSAGRVSSLIRNMVQLKKEEWKSDGWIGLVEMPAGMQGEIYEKLNSMTSGKAEAKVVRHLEI